MNEIVVKRHSFDMAKNRLKEFSEKTEAELKIDKVETEGVFLGLGNHKVTGYELNERLETIQKHLIDANATNNKVIKVFREIYNALDALDKDYITSIVANVKAIEKTSNDVRVQQETLKQHNEKLANQQNKCVRVMTIVWMKKQKQKFICILNNRRYIRMRILQTVG